MKDILLAVMFFSTLQVTKVDNGVQVKVKAESFNGYKMSVKFNLAVADFFSYDPEVFSKYRANTSLDESEIAEGNFNPSKFHNCYVVLENENQDKKILFVDYELIGHKRVVTPPDAFWSPVRVISKRNNKSFCIDKVIFSLDELKIKKSDKRIRLLYVSKPLKRNQDVKIISSNWIDLTNLKSTAK